MPRHGHLDRLAPHDPVPRHHRRQLRRPRRRIAPWRRPRCRVALPLEALEAHKRAQKRVAQRLRRREVRAVGLRALRRQRPEVLVTLVQQPSDAVLGADVVAQRHTTCVDVRLRRLDRGAPLARRLVLLRAALEERLRRRRHVPQRVALGAPLLERRRAGLRAPRRRRVFVEEEPRQLAPRHRHVLRVRRRRRRLQHAALATRLEPRAEAGRNRVVRRLLHRRLERAPPLVARRRRNPLQQRRLGPPQHVQPARRAHQELETGATTTRREHLLHRQRTATLPRQPEPRREQLRLDIGAAARAHRAPTTRAGGRRGAPRLPATAVTAAAAVAAASARRRAATATGSTDAATRHRVLHTPAYDAAHVAVELAREPQVLVVVCRGEDDAASAKDLL